MPPPDPRAPLCSQAWAVPDFGWWTRLWPHFGTAFESRRGAEQQEKAYAQLIAAARAFAKQPDGLRRAQ
ncbi:hypothetical protein [Streptomyces sp. NPDC090021]|uniref:hypothetical protein n=1 Tax=Streptomyces sp. NPDC090021 TaxID=3365919 RepID=UPI00381D9E1D